MDACLSGEEPSVRALTAVYEALESAIEDSDMVRLWVYMAQAYASEWAKWERASGSPSLYWTDDEIGDFGTFVHQVDNRSEVRDFMVWSVGSDGVDGWSSVVGPGGADDLYWPPVLSIQRMQEGF